MMPDEMPDDLAGLDDIICSTVLDAALQGVADAEEYARKRVKHIEEHGVPDRRDFRRGPKSASPARRSTALTPVRGSARMTRRSLCSGYCRDTN